MAWRSLPREPVVRRCLAELASLGYSDARLIAAGMEGLVFRLDQQLVAKVWPSASTRQLETLKALQAFYRALARHAFAVHDPAHPADRLSGGRDGSC